MAEAFVFGTGQTTKEPNFVAQGIPLTNLGDASAASVTTSAAELNLIDGLTATAAELNKVKNVASTGSIPVIESRMFTESGAGTYTATVTIPANSMVIDVIWNQIIQSDAATSSTLNVGDAGDADGYIINVNAKTATVGAAISNLLSVTGSGAYKGAPKWYESQGTITATLVTVGAGSAGRGRLTVIYATAGTIVNATKA